MSFSGDEIGLWRSRSSVEGFSDDEGDEGVFGVAWEENGGWGAEKVAFGGFMELWSRWLEAN